MVVKRPSSSSASSSASISSADDITKPCGAVKFLCSFGGRILPRYPDGRLRYVGGETRFLAVRRSIPFSDLRVKLGELCGAERVNLRCKLPTQDLDALVTITSDEDLANLMEEYDLACPDPHSSLKIRAFLHPTPTKSPQSATPPAISTPNCSVLQQSASTTRHLLRHGRSIPNHPLKGFPVVYGFPVAAASLPRTWRQQ
ncbi:hypothetical protein KSP39_PZI017499 [Platanthera zijinensis]|uniref:PB1 domain-containing protein n=1 Tax=Platanthera zijinensis TaxID=2320716 RepID=A0AAP0B5E1_9ASPA